MNPIIEPINVNLKTEFANCFAINSSNAPIKWNTSIECF